MSPLIGTEILMVKSAQYYTEDVWQKIWKVVKVPEVYRVLEWTREAYHSPDGVLEMIRNIQDYGPGFSIEFEDVLLSRRKTTGMIESKHRSNDVDLVFIDMGGQRSERRKWTNSFQGCNVIVFVVAISEYNQVCYEDDSTNRLQESLKLFGDIVNTIEATKDKDVILLFTKIDLFEAKLERFPFEEYFPKWVGSPRDFIEEMFLSVARDRRRYIHSYFVNLLDVSDVERMLFDNLYRYDLRVVTSERFENKRGMYRKKFVSRPQYEVKHPGRRIKLMLKSVDVTFNFQ